MAQNRSLLGGKGAPGFTGKKIPRPNFLWAERKILCRHAIPSQKPHTARELPVCPPYLSSGFMVGTKSSTHDSIPFCKFYRLYMGFYSTSLHHSHLFRESKNEVWCKKWCKWCIAIFSFGFYSIAISLVYHSTTFSS